MLYSDIKTIEEEQDEFMYIPEEELVFETPEDTIKQASVNGLEENSKHNTTKSLPKQDLHST